MKLIGLLSNKFNARLTLSREVLEMAEEVAAQLGSRVLPATIRRGVDVAMAPAHGQSVLTYKPSSKPAADLMEVVNIIAGPRFPAPERR